MDETGSAGARRYLNKLEAGIRALLELGLGALAWVATLSAAAGVCLVFSAPKFSAGLHPKYGTGIVVALCTALGMTLALGAAKAISGQRDFASSFRLVADAVRRYGTWLLLVIFGLTAARGLERQNPFVVLSLAVASAWVVGQWAWAWLPKWSGRLNQVNERTWWIGLGLLVLSYTIALSVLSVNNHLAFNTGRADLGYYVSIFRRSSLGDPLGCTICGGGNHLSGHFDPILVLLSPLYLLYPEAETVLVLQALLLGSSMVPLYLLARNHGLGGLGALVLCVCFGLHPALHGINLFDFHSLALVVPAALWLLWARDTGRWKSYWVLLALFLLIREDAALILVIIGADTLLGYKRYGVWTGALTALVGAGYFLLVKTLILSGADPLNPGTGQGYAYYYKDLVPKGTGTLGLLNTVLSNPAKVLPFLLQEAKVLYWLQLLLPLLALPLLAPRGRLLLFYGVAFTLLASREHVYSVHFHYSSVVLPFLFYLAVLALARPKRISRQVGRFLGVRPLPREGVALMLAACLAASVVISWRFGAFVPNRTFHAGFRPLQRKPSAGDLKRDQQLKEVCRKLPEGATVAASEPHLPHLGRCAGYYVKAKRHKADYLIWNFPKGPTSAEIRAEVKKGYWKEVETIGSFKLFKNHYPKGYSPPKSAKAKRVRGKNANDSKRVDPTKALEADEDEFELPDGEPEPTATQEPATAIEQDAGAR